MNAEQAKQTRTLFNILCPFPFSDLLRVPAEIGSLPSDTKIKKPNNPQKKPRKTVF